MPEIVGVAEIAAAYGVARNSAWRWTQRDDFPEPLARLATGPVWRWRDIEKWAAKTLPLGRPKKS